MFIILRLKFLINLHLKQTKLGNQMLHENMKWKCKMSNRFTKPPAVLLLFFVPIEPLNNQKYLTRNFKNSHVELNHT